MEHTFILQIIVFVMEINLISRQLRRQAVIQGLRKLSTSACLSGNAIKSWIIALQQFSTICRVKSSNLFLLIGSQVSKNPGKPTSAKAWHWWSGHSSCSRCVWYLQPGPHGSLRGNLFSFFFFFFSLLFSSDLYWYESVSLWLGSLRWPQWSPGGFYSWWIWSNGNAYSKKNY